MNVKRVLIPGAVLLVGAALVYFVTGLSSTGGVALKPGDASVVSLGAEVYAQNCASCHGENLEGEPNWRVRKADGRLPAPPHDASGHTWHHTDDVLFQLTKYGPAALVGGDYESDMPAYQGTLSDSEISASLAFIKSTWPQDIRSRHDAMNAAISNQRKQGNSPE